MGHMSYIRVGRRSSSSSASTRGFKINPKRFSVQCLRARFVFLFRILSKLRFSYRQVLKSLKKATTKRSNIIVIKRNNSSSSSSSKSLFMEASAAPVHQCRLRSFGRSNSFYAEAIADCLEFIKRSSVSSSSTSSVSVDQKTVCSSQRLKLE